MGCWAIGGPFWDGETPHGWGEVDDDESISAIYAALDKGVNFFDTAPIPGFRTVQQVEENAKSMEFGPLMPEQMRKIAKLLERPEQFSDHHDKGG
jgi:aryl-alcohol dehydrogenase-like predicted oxidoreductase